jgi:hypothetical protein
LIRKNGTELSFFGTAFFFFCGIYFVTPKEVFFLSIKVFWCDKKTTSNAMPKRV